MLTSSVVRLRHVRPRASDTLRASSSVSSSVARPTGAGAGARAPPPVLLSHSLGAAGQAHTLVRVPGAASAGVAEAQSRVWGTVTGNGERSGRKWLRRKLRGPPARAWYGVSFRELLPNFITPLKEDFFRAEQALNRVGKTRITGKIKSPPKPLADTLAFEDALEEVRGVW